MDLQHLAPHPDRRMRPSTSPQAEPFEFLGSFFPAYGIERAAMLTQPGRNRNLHRPHLLTRS
jgi:hypothetical protein